MELFGFRKPKWQSNDPNIRRSAVQDLSEQDIELLMKMATEDDDKEVRLGALAKINDPEVLNSLVESGLDAEFSSIVWDKLNRICSEMLVEAEAFTPAEAKLLDTIKNPEVLCKVAIRALSTDVRIAAVHSLADEELLSAIIEQPCGKETGLAAVEKIEDITLLQRLAGKASNKAVRKRAAEKAAALDRSSIAERETADHDNELAKLLREAEEIAVSNQWDTAGVRLDEIRKLWQSFDPGGTHIKKSALDHALARFQSRKGAFEARRQAELQRAEEFAARIKKLEDICSALENLTGLISEDAEVRYQEIVCQWPGETDIPKVEPFTSLKDRFDKACQSFLETQERIKQERSSIKQIGKDLERLERLTRDMEFKKAEATAERLSKEVDDRQFRFFDCADLKDRLKALKERLSAREKESEDILRRKREENLKERQKLCMALEALLEADNHREAEKKAKGLRKKWSRLKWLSDKEVRELNKRFNSTMDRFHERQREFFIQRDWEFWANKTLKEELCKSVEALDDVADLAYVSEQVKKAQAKWKEIGAVPREDAETLWQRFHSTCQRNFERCQPFFEEFDRMRAQNVERMEAMCREAEELSGSDDWDNAANKLKTLQAEWKAFAQLPRRKEIKLYRRFRKSCDIFFGRLSHHYEDLNEVRLENLKQKEELCVQAEALAAAPISGSVKAIRDLQTQWKKIGSVPRSEGKMVWKRFRAACDAYFEWLDRYRLENLGLKEKLCEQVEEIVGSAGDGMDMDEAAETLARLQSKWKEIGPVPKDKKEAIWQRFNKPCNEFFRQKRQRVNRFDNEQRENLEKKMLLLQEIETIARSGSKNSAETIERFQKQWRDSGPVPKEEESALNEHFKASCDAFIHGNQKYFENLKQARLENQKKKEALCFQLEKIVGVEPAVYSEANANKALTVADEIKLAMEANFTLSSMGDDRRRKSEEIRRLQQEWKKTGPVPPDQEQFLWNRFRNALDAFFSKEGQG